ncbi:hypothetical protein K440DRAFT_591776 [Wilcoxina mikolae CBS 423.85]|nr:hypothetical protein K440DRAFT_591776 [Wilcoxina mikolae CBS 423.85]
MPPHNLRQLTRRSLTSNLLIYSRCPYRLPLTLAPPPRPPPFLAAQQQCRTLSFKDLFSRKKGPQRPDTPPGVDTLNLLVRHLDKKLGPAPPVETVAKAIADMIGYWQGRTMRDEQAALMLRGYKYVRTARDPEGKTLIPLPTLASTLVALRGGSNNQLALATLLWDDLLAEGYTLKDVDIFYYVTGMCLAGYAREAAEMCRRLEGQFNRYKVWDKVLDGFVRQDDEAGLLETMEYLKADKRGVPNGLHYHPVAFYCGRNDLNNAKVWYDKGFADRKKTTLPFYIAILRACLRTGQLEWGTEVLEKLLQLSGKNSQIIMGKEAWEVTLQFAAAVGIGHANRMLKIMEARGVEALDVDTMNGLISGAISQDRYDLMERFLRVMGARQIDPNYATLELQLLSYIKRSDIPSAISVFEDLKYTQDIPDGYTGDIPQQLLRRLAETYPDPESKKAFGVYNDLVDMKVLLTSDTILPLLNMLLESESFENARSLLNRHIGHYTPHERKSIIDCLIEHAQQEKISLEASWETYLLLVRSFPETSKNHRQTMMNHFFSLGSPQAAVRVLEHMNMTEDRKPNKFQYSAAFVGLGQAGDVEGLQNVQRMLNMDAYVEVDTVLLNTLMYAYARCGLFERAFIIYDEIARSREGPDAATISQVFDMCGRFRNGGLDRARNLWSKFRRLPLTENNIASYVEALARHEAWDEAWRVVREMETEQGIKPGHRILSTLHSTFRRNRLLELEKWLETEHAEIWAEVKEELNATMNEKVPDKVEVDGEVYIFVDEDTGKTAGEQEMFKTSLNLRGSEGFDEERAVRDRREWEKRKKVGKVGGEGIN